ncbi:MAG: hypothetical protein RDV48_11620 [Candidatus Eremiobacteraeota bacterium]|nr:hypothetical protein [Candidatus Eremiobacteraeota bacterium]
MDEKTRSLLTGKSLPHRLMGTMSLLFRKDADIVLQELITSPDVPEYQKYLAIWEAGTRKHKSLRNTLIEVVKAPESLPRRLRLAAASSLVQIGEIYSLDVPSALILDLMEIYLNTLDPKLYEKLHQLFLMEKNLPIYKIMVKTLQVKFNIETDISAQSWEVLARALSLCFEYHYPEAMATTREEMKKLPRHKDKDRQKVEQLAYLNRRVLAHTENVRSEFRKLLEGNEKGERLVTLIAYPSLNYSYHQMCKVERTLAPLLQCVLDTRPGVRLLAIKELSDIASPVAFNFYRSLILGEEKAYSDTVQNLLGLMAALATRDRDALEMLLSLLKDIAPEELPHLIDELASLCETHKAISARVVFQILPAVRKGEYPEKVAQELVTRILGTCPTEEVIDLLVEMASGEGKFPSSVRKRAGKVLVHYHSPDFPFYQKVAACIRRLPEEDVPGEITRSMFREIREMPLEENIRFLRQGICDGRDEVRKGAFSSYVDLIKSGKFTDDEVLAFLTSLFDEMAPAPDDIKILALELLKTNPMRSDELRRRVRALFLSDSREVRNLTFDLFFSWFSSTRDSREEEEVLQDFLDILLFPEFPHDEIYKKAAGTISDSLVTKASLYERKGQDVFLALQKGLSSDLSTFQKKILCEILDNAIGGQNSQARLQAQWIMENLLRSPQVAPVVHLHVLQLLVVKEGKLLKYFPKLLQLLSIDDSYVQKVTLEIMAGGFAQLPRYSAEEKMQAMKMGKNSELVEYVKWEIMLITTLLPQLLKLLGGGSTDHDVISLVLSVLRRIEGARSHAATLFSFKQEQFGDTVRERALESLAYLVYPPFSEEETLIINELKHMASDAGLAPNYRLSAMQALVHIGIDDCFAFFLDRARNDNERHDMRLLALQGLNALKNPSAREFFLEILHNPRYSSVFKETVLEGLKYMGHSSIVEPLLTLIDSAEFQKAGERARAVLEECGFGETLALRTLTKDIEGKRQELEMVEHTLARDRVRLNEAERTREETMAALKALNDSLGKCEGRIKSETALHEKHQAQWEKLRMTLEGKIREILPEWPSEKKLAKEHREAYIELKEHYREHAESYEHLIGEIDARLAVLSAERDGIVQQMRDGRQKESDLETDCKDLKVWLAQLSSERDGMASALDTIESQARQRDEAFQALLPSIDRSLAEKNATLQKSRIREWELRGEYYRALMRNASKAK